MERYLITQSLLASWQYMFDCPEGYEEEAREAFEWTLCRLPQEPTEAIRNGIDFENAVYAVAAGDQAQDLPILQTHPEWESGVRKIASALLGAPVQVRLSRELEVAGWHLLCYGVLDAVKAGVIYDVKFSNRPLGSIEAAGKYLDSPQHPMYFYLCPEAYAFHYLLSDGDDVYVEAYRRGNRDTVRNVIVEFVTSLKSSGYVQAYMEHWKAQ